MSMSDVDAQLDDMLLDLVQHIDRVGASRKRNRESAATCRKRNKEKLNELVAENKALVAENENLKQQLSAMGIHNFDVSSV